VDACANKYVYINANGYFDGNPHPDRDSDTHSDRYTCTNGNAYADADPNVSNHWCRKH